MNAVRTTIELKPEHRARLLELAARRNDKGFSNLVGEALDLYFEALEERERRRLIALRLRGCFAAAEVEALREAIRERSAPWR